MQNHEGDMTIVTCGSKSYFFLFALALKSIMSGAETVAVAHRALGMSVEPFRHMHSMASMPTRLAPSKPQVETRWF
jgi:hypothetical protein